MKLGLGLYRHMLTAENLAFAKQAGATCEAGAIGLAAISGRCGECEWRLAARLPGS